MAPEPTPPPQPDPAPGHPAGRRGPGFRTRLLIALTLSVAATVLAILIVTRTRVLQVFETVAETQARTRLRTLADLQDARALPVRRRCAEFAGDVRIRSLLLRLEGAVRDHQPDPEGLDDLYQTTEDQLALLRGTVASQESAEGTPGFHALFFRLVDPAGTVLIPPRWIDAGLVRPVSRRHQLDRTLQDMINPGLLAGPNPQDAGFIVLPDGLPQRLAQVLFTRITDPEDNHTLGFLVLGFEATFQTSTADDPDTSTGLWVNQTLHGGPFIGDTAARLSPLLQRGIAPSSGPSAIRLPSKPDPQIVYTRPLNPGSSLPPALQVCLVSLRTANQTQSRLTLQIVGISTLALLASLATSVPLAHSLAQPIRALAHAARQIGRGRFETRVDIRQGDELGQLGRAFNQMAADLALKDKYRSILDMVTDREIAGELLRGGVALGGEVREVTILFCDIRGFTSLTSDMPPEQVIQLLNEHMTALTEVVHAHQGVVDKFVGDLIMAMFGAPQNHADATGAAVRCASEMIRRRHQLNQARQPVEIGIGIATGIVVAGCMGSASRLNYTVLGERVNLASRLCSSAGRMEIVMDETTHGRLKASDGTPPGPEWLTLKGFSDKVPAWRIRPLSA